MQTASYVPAGRADRLEAAAAELHEAALDLLDEWAEAHAIGDASTEPTAEAVAVWEAAERFVYAASLVADSRREA